MTFMAHKSGGGKNIVIRTTYGPVTIEVEEEPGHVRSFWGELGRLLREIEHGPDAPEPAQLAFGAYVESTGGLNVRGEQVPDWEDLGEGVQEAWRAAARNLTG
jgi:hypothetical protein